MNIYIERDQGPSKLDERLEVFRDPETEHIILTPEEARELLLEALLGYYRRLASEGVSPHNRPSSKIEALAQIVEMRLSGDKFDYTETVETISKRRAQQSQERREMEEKLHIITPAPPPQAEI
ncbi:hypothetical protein KKH23_00575 [Patescibacteria group bacterium]|nr:hypothetical protein [Patescibacteria group bacterium]MBU0776970.1 hypothetical protein [Patescibacteria group bacterium]MBU0845688.1 hypothetical protein [Patescibacteria group bacterium]MBU0922999.1 hypothetical protein [Patescibacteria group bacterium]MBU1066932.1 hypothetical protein [Patescibacteria group bacterium]